MRSQVQTYRPVASPLRWFNPSVFSGDRAIRPVGYGLRHVAHKLDYKNLKLSWQQQQYMTLTPQPSRPPQACSAHILLDIPETAAQAAVAASAVAASDGGALPVVAWVVVGAATVACFVFMGQAFTEAETAIKRRDEGERRKQQEDEAVEAARKQKIKDMFERL